MNMQNSAAGFGNKEETSLIIPHQANQVNTNFSGQRGFGNQKKSFYCTFYNSGGHTIDRCYKKHGYSPNHKFKGKGNGGYDNDGALKHVPFAGRVHVNREILASEQIVRQGASLGNNVTRLTADE